LRDFNSVGDNIKHTIIILSSRKNVEKKEGGKVVIKEMKMRWMDGKGSGRKILIEI
jgi:hypothetical protein